ncbi:GDSL-type esterase/lipase family protein [Nocardia sp. NPDC024068]|uniref:SGNH/GDSL hydrolase family protein n=1 Tax=Nocardia sp. NPDC024068 TaxID=3157197 RepID=UPI0033C40E2E
MRLGISGRRRQILIAVSVVLATVLGAAGAVGYLTFVRSPADAPGKACRDGRPAHDGPVVVAAGASMTQGTLGADWVGALRERPEFAGHRFVNAGVNGDTAADLLDRLDSDVLACRPDTVVVLVGTNDVRGETPLDEYRDHLDAIVGRLTAAGGIRVALMSLPPMGEDLDTRINHELADYNRIIAETAAHHDIDYLPLHERMSDLVRREGNPRSDNDFSFALAFGAATRHYLFRQSWDQAAHSNGLNIFVDNIHLSDRGGAVVIDLVSHWLASAGH